MSVSFRGYSNVRSHPLQYHFRCAHKARSEADKQDIGETLHVCMRNDAAKDKFWKTIGAEESFLHVCWYSNTVWRTTADTEESSAICDIYSDFVSCVHRASIGQTVYLPLDATLTDCHGVWNATDCMKCLTSLDRVRSYFVPEKWNPFDEKNVANDIHESSYFFCSLYEAMIRGAESGIFLSR